MAAVPAPYLEDRRVWINLAKVVVVLVAVAAALIVIVSVISSAVVG